jgi:hypothetical protein
LWSIARALHTPIDNSITQLTDIPFTISYTIRKRIQIDNLSELPKEKRPPDQLIWDGSSEELDEWIERVFNKNESLTTEIDMADFEG